MQPHPTSFGVFKPVDPVLMSFATASQSDSAVAALQGAGFGDTDLSRYTPAEMQAQAEQDIANASAMASLGQDLNLVKAHLALAQQGQSFVVVSTPHGEQVQPEIQCMAFVQSQHWSFAVGVVARSDSGRNRHFLLGWS